MMLELTSAQRSALRARAHALRPVVMIGDSGLGAAVLDEIDKHLLSHELIKIRVFFDQRAARETLLKEICKALAAAPVQHIGKILVVYRPRPEDAKTGRKTRARPKPPRRTKRSFQR